jgi:hypothetical protein
LVRGLNDSVHTTLPSLVFSPFARLSGWVLEKFTTSVSPLTAGVGRPEGWSRIPFSSASSENVQSGSPDPELKAWTRCSALSLSTRLVNPMYTRSSVTTGVEVNFPGSLLLHCSFPDPASIARRYPARVPM